MDQTDVLCTFAGLSRRPAIRRRRSRWTPRRSFVSRRQGAPPPPKENLLPGSLVFLHPQGAVSCTGPDCHRQWWWKWTPDANWRAPEEVDSIEDGGRPSRRPRLLVRCGGLCEMGSVTTEAEWGIRCRGRAGPTSHYVWGDTTSRRHQHPYQPGGGPFPHKNTAADGYEGTSRSSRFPANGYSLSDMSGNVWQWCSDWYQVDLCRHHRA